MPSGFYGGAAIKYLTDVVEALNASEQVLARNPFARLTNHAVAPPNISIPASVTPPYEPSSAQSGGASTGTGSSSNIVVDANGYDSESRRLQSADEDMGSEIFRVMCFI